jgi:hypothetical protein
MRAMRVACAVVSIFVATVAASVLPSLAQDKAPPNPLSPVSNILQTIAHNPEGWTRNMNGSYRQAESDILCPVQFRTFILGDVTGPSKDNPNILGVCHYSDGLGRTGAIRIRKYVAGWGSDISLAGNDRRLMSADAPPMLMRSSVDRRTGAYRLTVTTVRHGYLIDCSVAQIEHSVPKGDFPLYCTTIPSDGSAQ